MVDPENLRKVKLLQIFEVSKAHEATTRNISFLKFRKINFVHISTLLFLGI